jgi:hypothetical protein
VHYGRRGFYKSGMARVFHFYDGSMTTVGNTAARTRSGRSTRVRPSSSCIRSPGCSIDAAALATALRQRIAGQDQVCQDAALPIRIRAAMVSTTRPRLSGSGGIFPFTGPPGSGETLLGECLAEFSRREPLHSVSGLTRYLKLTSAYQSFSIEQVTVWTAYF